MLYSCTSGIEIGRYSNVLSSSFPVVKVRRHRTEEWTAVVPWFVLLFYSPSIIFETKQLAVGSQSLPASRELQSYGCYWVADSLVCLVWVMCAIVYYGRDIQSQCLTTFGLVCNGS